MKLLSARVCGVGRLIDTTIKLDQKLVAIVGPNEAGKTTLLKAIAKAASGEALSATERSRAMTTDDQTHFITLKFRLDENDAAAVADLNLEAKPTHLTLARRAEGSPAILTVEPRPQTAVGDAAEQSAALIASQPSIESISHRQQVDDDGNSIEEVESERAERTAFASDLAALASEIDTFLSETKRKPAVADGLRQRAVVARATIARYSAPAVMTESLARITEWLEISDPDEEVQNRLLARTPDIALFEDADRALLSAYTLDDNLLSSVPPALANLARLADLDLAALVRAVEAGQIAVRNTIRNKANTKLRNHFQTAWKQSNLVVEINIENKTLRVGLTENDVYASVIEERSQGLRTFVALSAFLAARDSGRPTILLIDEAENHLHINAQADLVEMFAEQEQAEKVVYTTHSPACLPADLGIGIRAVVVDSDEQSHVENSFWSQRGPALTSLMMAMGASAAAFTPARCVVVAEGPSDMILLPTLLRLATGLRRLPYQVAPGLSELPRDLYPDLDFEASRVAYLVDGDGGGDALTRAVGRVVPEDVIVNLRVPGVENLLPAELYENLVITAIRDGRGEWQPTSHPSLPPRADASWSRAVAEWLEPLGLEPPSKVVVAALATEAESLGIDEDAALVLREVHADICTALRIRNDSETVIHA